MVAAFHRMKMLNRCLPCVPVSQSKPFFVNFMAYLKKLVRGFEQIVLNLEIYIVMEAFLLLDCFFWQHLLCIQLVFR